MSLYAMRLLGVRGNQLKAPNEESKEQKTWNICSASPDLGGWGAPLGLPPFFQVYCVLPGTLLHQTLHLGRYGVCGIPELARVSLMEVLPNPLRWPSRP
jgi:hypothetical protein